jgi:hypothetical protein
MGGPASCSSAGLRPRSPSNWEFGGWSERLNRAGSVNSVMQVTCAGVQDEDVDAAMRLAGGMRTRAAGRRHGSVAVEPSIARLGLAEPGLSTLEPTDVCRRSS